MTMWEAASLDHLIGAGEQRWRHSEAEYPRRRVIDDKLELGGLHDRQVRRFRTLEDATRIDTDLTIRIRQAGSVAHQAADFGIFTRPIGGRERVARRQEDQLDTSADKKGATADENRVGSIARKCCEGRIDVPAGADIKGLDLQSHGARSRVHVSQYGLGVGIRRIDEHGDATSCGYEFAQEFQPFGYQLVAKKIDARRVAAGPGEAGDKAQPDRGFRDGKDDRDCRGCCLGRERHRRAFRERLVVTVVVVAGPDSLPAPRCRLPTPARVAIETNAGDERRRAKKRRLWNRWKRANANRLWKRANAKRLTRGANPGRNAKLRAPTTPLRKAGPRNPPPIAALRNPPPIAALRKPPPIGAPRKPPPIAAPRKPPPIAAPRKPPPTIPPRKPPPIAP